MRVSRGGGGSAASIAFTPAGTVAATTVQAAVEEVASEGGSSALATAVDCGHAGQWCLPYPFGGVGTHAITNNQIQAVRFIAAKTRTITKVGWDLHGTVAGGDIYVGLWDATGARVAVSAEDVDAAASGTTNKLTSLTAGYQVVQGTEYYVGIACSGVCTLRGVSCNDGDVNLRFNQGAAAIGLIDVFGDNFTWASGPPTQLALDVTTGFSTYPLLSIHE
jgi:hypothetical protein